MCPTDQSLSQTIPNVNIQHVTPNRRVRAAAAARTPEQIEADNAHTAKLRAQDAVLLAGPVLVGSSIRVPSWRWNPELVRLLHQFQDAEFKKELPYTVEVMVNKRAYSVTITMSTWILPYVPGHFAKVREIYERVFARELAMARMIQRTTGGA